MKIISSERHSCGRLSLLIDVMFAALGPGGGGHSTFFQVGVCGPDFRSVGLAN